MNPLAKILIVDDEPRNVNYLEQELEGLGYQTVSATNGQEALEKVSAESPDLILLDVLMPGMDGFTVCRILREKEETQLIPIVFMTALGERENRLRGFELGADAYLIKPPDQQELLAQIQNAVKRKQEVDRRIQGQAVPDKTFRLEGEYWTVAYQGRVARIRDTTGLHYIAYLLRYPHRQIHVLELAASIEGPFESPAMRTAGERKTGALGELGLQTGFGDAGEILDPQAKAAYKQRLEELWAELEEAQGFNDLGRAAKAQEEIEILNRELSRAVGMGGKDRRAASAVERARVNVQRAIKAALDKLSKHHPALGNYLAGTIKTGIYCSYTPNLDLPSPWQL